MIPELGHLALVLALCFSVLLAWFGLAGAATHNRTWMNATSSLVNGQFVFTLLAFAALSYAFANDDFSVAYVAANSNTLLPWYYKVSAVWGAHEGSFLLWTLIMSIWTLAVAIKGVSLPVSFQSRVLGIMGLLNMGFFSFLLWTSNPFNRLVPLTPLEGADLNPLLQDFGLIVHPPLLYVGYVGFSVAFAFAIAALLSGRMDTAWARWSRPWTNVAWGFLTLGITLGSWWAYYELGWGGWWFWDPVENASFMPWLAGTALVHSLAVSEKRGTFKSWTLLLAITTFSLSLLGAFIVRSGVLTSVHAFAVDPTRGLFILAFLVVVVGGSLTLYAFRASVITSRARYTLFSREAFLLINNILLVIAMAIVLFGTLYPLAYEAVTGGAKISVGVPYFNRFFIPLMLFLALALGLVPALQWKRTKWKRTPKDRWLKGMVWIMAGSLVLGLGIPLIISQAVAWQVAATLVFAFWILGSHGRDLIFRARLGLSRVPTAYWGMTLAHLAFVMTISGVALTSQFSIEKDLRMSPGDVITLGGMEFRFEGTSTVSGPNYVAQQGRFIVNDGGDRLILKPEKRRYVSNGGNVMTEASIDPGFLRDVYVALGEQLEDGDWAVRLQIKPFVRWIWIGGLFIALGGFVAVTDARYRRLRVREVARAGGQGAPA